MNAQTAASPRLNLLGVHVTAFDLTTAVAEMIQAVHDQRRAYVCTCPVYTLMQGHERAEVRAALNAADWVTPDGMPVVWALRLLGARSVGRVYGPDLLLALTERSAEAGYAQFYLGGAPGVAEQLAVNMKAHFPGLRVAGTLCPPFRALTVAEEAELVRTVNDSNAHILWVGLGSPKQDVWMQRFRSRLSAPLLVGVGAAFDFFTGRQKQAPRWMQRSGLEWAFRLAHEPRRLWHRYLIYNPKFVFQLLLQLARLRRYE